MDDIKSGEPFFGRWYIKDLIESTSLGSLYLIYCVENGVYDYSVMKIMGVPSDKQEIKQLQLQTLDYESTVQYYKERVADLYREVCLLEEFKNTSHLASYLEHMIFQRGNGVGYDVILRMEYLPSLTQKYLISTLSHQDILRLGKEICDALQLCERYHIIHGNIRLESIFVTENGSYKLGDFSFSKYIRQKELLNNSKDIADYMAPEVYQGKVYDMRADIYSLGLVLYQLLNNNRLPFLMVPLNEATTRERLLAIEQRFQNPVLPKPVHATEELAKVIAKACNLDPKQRYQNPEEFKDALTALAVYLEADILFQDVNYSFAPEDIYIKNEVVATYMGSESDEDGHPQEKDVTLNDVLLQEERIQNEKREKVEIEDVEVEKVKIEEVEIENAEVEKVEIGKEEVDQTQEEHSEVDKVEIDKVEIKKVEVYKIKEGKFKADKVELKKAEVKKKAAEEEAQEGTFSNEAELPPQIANDIYVIKKALHKKKLRSRDIIRSKIEQERKMKRKQEIIKEENGKSMRSWILIFLILVFTASLIILLTKIDLTSQVSSNSAKGTWQNQNSNITVSPTKIVEATPSEGLLPTTKPMDGPSQELTIIPEIEQSPAIIDKANLITIDETGQNLTSLDEVKDLDKAIAIDLSKNNLSDIASLQAAIYAETLVLSHNRIVNVEALHSLINLKALDISNNQVTSFIKLRSLENLEILSASKNLITSLEGVEKLKSLRILYLNDNSIQDISILKELTSLEMIDLSNNKVKERDLEALRKALPECIIIN